MILVFKEFLQINSTTDFCTLCKRVSRFSREKFSSHSAEKFRRGTLLCFRKFQVEKKFMDKREGEVSRFPSKVVCLTVPKNAVGEPFSLSLLSGIEKVWMRGWRGGGNIKIFCRKFLVSQGQKISQGSPLGCHYFRVSKNFMLQRVMSRFAVEIFLSHSAEIFRRGTP